MVEASEAQLYGRAIGAAILFVLASGVTGLSMSVLRGDMFPVLSFLEWGLGCAALMLVILLACVGVCLAFP